MKALSIRQPWANAIALGLKTAEIRTWKTDYRGLLLIHASKTIQNNDEATGFVERIYQKYGSTKRHAHAQPCGVIIALAELTDCVPALTMPNIHYISGGVAITKDDYAFLLDNVTPIRPYEYKGQLGLFDIPHDVEKQLQYMTDYGYANNILHLYPQKGLL